MESFVANLPCLRITQEGECDKIIDHIIKEERIALYLNGCKILSTMSIPQNQDAHAIGFLLSEGVIESLDDVKEIEIAKDGLSVYINAKIQEDNLSNLYREKTLTSGCCVGVTGNFEGKIIEKFVSSQVRVKMGVIWDTLKFFYEDNDLFNLTGCVHKAMIVDNQGNILASAIDVGRHNAIDKVVGMARLQKIPIDECLLFVSGRLSLEMVIKSAMHNIPILVSKSATTQLAIQSAQKLGITLVGFARDYRCNVYTHNARLIYS